MRVAANHYHRVVSSIATHAGKGKSEQRGDLNWIIASAEAVRLSNQPPIVIFGSETEVKRAALAPSLERMVQRT